VVLKDRRLQTNRFVHSRCRSNITCTSFALTIKKFIIHHSLLVVFSVKVLELELKLGFELPHPLFLPFTTIIRSFVFWRDDCCSKHNTVLLSSQQHHDHDDVGRKTQDTTFPRSRLAGETFLKIEYEL
jgi:hypothetical protein